ncbi:polyphenol oxidase family protein [Pseudarthrobacter sp. J1738]|uniref:polyphenol oxidase family protein n=1 Tax=unclassified Pseudarthrobacter TaxID=2647000 RepID=UPI003D2A2A5F
MFWWRGEVEPGIHVAFTSTDAGNLALHVNDDPDAVHQRRATLATAAGIPAFQYMSQVHGNDVAMIERAGQAPTADAMISRGTPLAVMVADCVPVVFFARDSNAAPIFAVAHAGRPGVVANVIGKTVDELRAAGATAISAWMGPSVCGECYEVPTSMREDVSALEPAAWQETSWGTPALDLPAAAAAQLERAGVEIKYRGECTLENQGLYSHRRDQRSGRFAGLIWSTHE